MRISKVLPVVAVIVVSAAMPAQALPFAFRPAGLQATVIPVRDGCGPFAHRSHYGYCKPNGDGEYGRGYGYDGYGPRRGPAFYGDGGYRERRCYVEETYDGPVRVCR